MARPKKAPDRDMCEIMSSIITPLVAAYLHPEGEADPNGHARLSDLCTKFRLSNLKMRKLLVTAGVYQSAKLTKVNDEYVDIADEVMKLYKQGMSEPDIMKALKLSRSTVNSLIPYSKKGAYNLELLPDGTHDMNNASLSSKHNKRYRKKKAVAEFRKNEQTKKPPAENADDLLEKLLAHVDPPTQKADPVPSTQNHSEDEKMHQCACCGKETLNLVRVGNNPDIGMCCEHCASVIMMELKKRKYSRPEKASKAGVLNTDVSYVDSDGAPIPAYALKFEVSDGLGCTHTFAVSSYMSSGKTYEAREIYKAGKTGKKLKSQPDTEYSFREYGPEENEHEIVERLICKTAKGVHFKTLEKEDFAGMTSQPVKNREIYLARQTGMIELENGYFKIDGEKFDGEGLMNLFSSYEGFRLHYQVMDSLDPVLEKNTYLMPVQIDDQTLLEELDELIYIFSERNRSTFISYKNVSAFDSFFEKLLGKLSFYYDRNPRGMGKIAGMKLIKRLREIDTDDDMFPEYQISQIQDRISEGEWFNHPETETVNETSERDRMLSELPTFVRMPS